MLSNFVPRLISRIDLRHAVSWAAAHRRLLLALWLLTGAAMTAWLLWDGLTTTTVMREVIDYTTRRPPVPVVQQGWIIALWHSLPLAGKALAVPFGLLAIAYLVLYLPLLLVFGVLLVPAAILCALLLPPAFMALLLLIPVWLGLLMPSALVKRIMRLFGEVDEFRINLTEMMRRTGLQGAPVSHEKGKAMLMQRPEFDRLRESNRDAKGARVTLGLFGSEVFDHATDKHVLIVAGSRGGKGRDLIIPHLRRYAGGIFCLDPKGENVEKTAAAREALGSRVVVIDPFGITKRPASRLNVLRTVEGDGAASAAGEIAEALVIGKEGDHWTSSARELLKGLILHVATWPGGKVSCDRIGEDGRTVKVSVDVPPPAARDLPAVRAALMDDLPLTLEAMRVSPDLVVRRIGGWGLTTPGDEWGSIASTAVEQTRMLDDASIALALSEGGDQVDFARWLGVGFRVRTQDGLEHMTNCDAIYVCLSAPKFDQFSKFLRLVTQAALNTMTDKVAAPALPVCFMLDELAQLGTLASVERAVTLGAGYGVQVWAIFQNLRQIERCYPASGIASFYGSAGIRCVFKANDNETVKYFAEASNALEANDIRRMHPQTMLVLLDDVNPVLVQRVPYFNGWWASLPGGGPAPASLS